jgi:hypothetical protein
MGSHMPPVQQASVADRAFVLAQLVSLISRTRSALDRHEYNTAYAGLSSIFKPITWAVRSFSPRQRMGWRNARNRLLWANGVGVPGEKGYRDGITRGQIETFAGFSKPPVGARMRKDNGVGIQKG